MTQKFPFYINSSYINSDTCALRFGAILHSEVTSVKYKNAEHLALSGLQNGYLFTVWELKAECRLVRHQLGTCALGDSNFLPLCAHAWMAVEETRVMIWGDKLYIHMLLNKLNSARGFVRKRHHWFIPSPPKSIFLLYHHLATWFPSSGQPTLPLLCIF